MLLTIAAPAGAVTFGEPDEGEHPNVGLIYFELPDGIFQCSGTLIASDVVLPAAHCTADRGERGTRMWVTFDEHVDIPDDMLALPDEEFGDWLDANHGFMRGTGVPHPSTTGRPTPKCDGPVGRGRDVQVGDLVRDRRGAAG